MLGKVYARKNTAGTYKNSTAAGRDDKNVVQTQEDTAYNDIIVLGDKTSSKKRCGCVNRCVKRNYREAR
jgi:hypothetical protein